MSVSPSHAAADATHAANADDAATQQQSNGVSGLQANSPHSNQDQHNEHNKNNQQQQMQQQQQINGYAQQQQQQSPPQQQMPLSHIYPLSSSKQLLEQQQQRQQQQQANAVHGQAHYQSSNKNLVEHAKSGQSSSLEGGQQGHAALPLHTSGVNAHYSQQINSANSGANSYGSNGQSPSLTISPHTGSPAGNSPYDASVTPYTPEGMQQQGGQNNMYSQGHSGHQQQQQGQGGSFSHSHHQQNFAPGPTPHSSPVNQAFAQVLVAGLPLSLTQAELGDIFSSLPSYERCGIACDPTTGLSIGRGWLVFASCDYANQAIAKMNGMSLAGNILTLSMMQPIGESTKSNIYVAGLPKQYTQVQLEELFRTFGTIIESKILMDPTGMSRGVAFVRYDNSNSAAQAITAVNGHVMADASHTYTIRVKFARDHHRNADPTLAMLTGTPSPNSPPQAQSHAPRPAAIYQSYIPPHVKARGDEISGGVALFVFHIPAEFTSRDLQELFAPCATVLSARIAIHPQTLESKGFGFVTCASMEEAHQAVTLLNGRRVGRKFIKVSFKKQQTNAPGPQQHMQGQPPQHQQQLQQHYSAASHQQQPSHMQQQQQSSQQAPHQRNPSLDINLSSLAAALSLSQNFNSQGAVSYPGPQSNGGWNQPAVVATPSSPSLLNYGNHNQSALPLHLLMQQMQLSQAFPSNYNSPQTNAASVQQQVHQQVAAQHQQQQQQQQQQQAQQQQHSSHHSHQSFGGGNYSPAPAVGAQNSWLPSSPINLPQSALQSSAGSVYNTNSNNYYQQQNQQQQQQGQQTQQSQQAQSQQHLFM